MKLAYRYRIAIFCLLLPALLLAQVVKVKRVVDGDTFVVEEGPTEYRVRMLYVDTPESVHPDKKRNIPLGKVASEWTKQRIEGKFVSLQQPGDHEKSDVFDRKLALVFIGGSCINLELIQAGLSPYYTKYGTADEPWDSKFDTAEKIARKDAKGIWGDPKLVKSYLKLKSKWGQKHPKKSRD